MIAASPSEHSCRPFDALVLAKNFGSLALRRCVLWLVARHLMRLALAGALAVCIGTLIMSDILSGSALIIVVLALVGAALTGVLSERALAAAETQVSVALRDAAGARFQALPTLKLRGLAPGSVAVALQRHPQAVAKLAIAHRSASLMLAIGPLVAAMALALVSWSSALLVLALTPVMILFFILVGETVRSRADLQEKSFSHLAGQFADRIRTLPTILASDAVASEECKLADRLGLHVERTTNVLRLAFLNAALIDLFVSLSVAMLAVFLGLGHLNLATVPGFSGLELWQSLFILMVAPEYFAPFRRFSDLYHVKADGLAAGTALDTLLAAPVAPAVDLPVVDQVLETLNLPEHGLVVIWGPSGSGKSTLLRRLVGVEGGEVPHAAFADGCVWIAADAHLSGRTLWEAIGQNPGSDPDDVHEAAEQVGLVGDTRLPNGLAMELEPGGANLSGGQRLRIATIRAMLAAGPVVADEPTAKLDPATAAGVRRAIRAIADNRLVIAATHDQELVALADRLIDLSACGRFEAAA